METLYAPFVRQGNPIYFMDEKSAELTKYAANAFLATKITFMNEIANFCELVGADVDKVRIGIGSDNRIGKRFLFPGIGYGGSCFPKDVQALVKSGLEKNFDFKILHAVMEVNQDQKTRLFPKMKNYFKGDLSNKKALYAAMEGAVIDSPRGKWTMSKAHNPIQDMYLRQVVNKENKVIGIAGKAVADPATGCRMV